MNIAAALAAIVGFLAGWLACGLTLSRFMPPAQAMAPAVLTGVLVAGVCAWLAGRRVRLVVGWDRILVALLILVGLVFTVGDRLEKRYGLDGTVAGLAIAIAAVILVDRLPVLRHALVRGLVPGLPDPPRRRSPKRSRDDWLQALVGLLRPELARRAGLVIGGVGISADPVAWRNSFAHGFCSWDQYGRHTAAINIAPDLTDPVPLAGTVAHELLHAGLPWAGHNWAFQEAADRIGLKVVTDGGGTDITPAFTAWAAPLLERLGPYPARDAGIVRPLSLPTWTNTAAAALAILAGLFTQGLAGPSLSFLVMPLSILVALGFLVGLTESYWAPQPRQRIALQLAMLAGPLLVGLAYAPFLVDAAGGQSDQGALFLHALSAAARSFPHAPLVLSVWLAYGLLVPVPAITLWRTRPVARYYRLGSYRGETPSFARARWNRNGLRLSRSHPGHVGLWLAAVELAARAERTRRGLPVTDAHGALEAELVPQSGFVIERHGNHAEVAAGTAGTFPDDELHAIRRALKWTQGQPGRRQFRKLPLMRPAIIVVHDLAPAAPVDPARRPGARFAYPED